MDLSPIGLWFLDKIGEKGIDFIYGKVTEGESIAKSFENCVIDTCVEFQNSYPDLLDGNFKYFFHREEVLNELSKLLFIFSDVNNKNLENFFDVETLPSNVIGDFIKTLRTKVTDDPNLQKLFANKILYNSIIDTNKKLTKISLNILNEITKLRSNFEDFFQKKFSYNKFINTYYTNSYNMIKEVNFFGTGLDSSYQKFQTELNKIYVIPKLSLDIRNSNFTNNIGVFDSDKRNFINIDHLFNKLKNIVIIGNPGSGKSVLLKAIMLDIVSSNHTIFNSHHLYKYLPIRIELKSYCLYRQKNNLSLLHYIINIFKLDYNIDYIEIEDLVSILNKEKVIVLFDGLDEIFDINDKITIRNDIQNFSDNYSTKSIVTSRTNGYTEAKFNQNFTELEILEFDEDQIHSYVSNWYCNSGLEKKEYERKVKELLYEAKDIPKELKTNPLLLSLIIILYKNNLILPKSKLEIYKSCTKTLIDKWDAFKNLKIDIDSNLLKRKETLLSELAYWQYNILSEKAQKISNINVKNHIANQIYTKIKISDDWSVCYSLAELFLFYAEKRTIYFNNNFTHKTFLEYYTAYWIYTNCDKKQKSDERDRIISKFINNPFWFDVIELLISMIDEDQPDNEIVDSIFEMQLKDNNNAEFLLSIMNKLKNIGSNQKKNVYKKCIENITESHKNDPSTNQYKRIFDISISKYDSNNEDLLIKAFNELLLSSSNDTVLILSIFSEIDNFNKWNLSILGLTYEGNIKKSIDSNSYLHWSMLIHKNSDFDFYYTHTRLFGWKNLLRATISPIKKTNYVALICSFFDEWLNQDSTSLDTALDSLESYKATRHRIIMSLMRETLIIHYEYSRSKFINKLYNEFTLTNNNYTKLILLFLLNHVSSGFNLKKNNVTQHEAEIFPPDSFKKFIYRTEDYNEEYTINYIIERLSIKINPKRLKKFF